MEQLVTEKSIKVNEVISKLLYKTQVLAAFVLQTNGKFDNFEEIAATIMDDPAIRNVLIAPKGVVSLVYPLADNESIIGFDMLSDAAGNKEAIQAMNRGELVFGGPFELKQGGMALVGRLPVFKANESCEDVFWGLVSVTLSYPQALAGAELDTLPRQGFTYEIWRINPDDNQRQVIASSCDNRKDLRFIEKQIIILNANWYFRLSPVRLWYQYPETWVLVFISLLISIMTGTLTQNNTELRVVKTRLESMVQRDNLTGILNRQGLFFEMERLIRLGKIFSLYYMDLNDFKNINDTCGHNAGDKVLIEFSRRIDKNTDGSHIFARVSGDEFILVHVENELSEDKMDSFWNKIDEELAKPIYEEGGHKLYLSFSRGKASFPKDGSTIGEVIAAADRKMYEGKQRPLRT